MKMRNEVVIAAVIFPENLPYLSDFIKSLNTQEFKNFDFFLINDGCTINNLENLLTEACFDYFIHNTKTTKNSPPEIRLELFGILKQSHYPIIVFGDTDDYFSSDRIGRINDEIKNNDAWIVFNDLTIISQSGEILDEKIWKRRIKDKTIDFDFLLNYNVLGLGNSAIRKELLQIEIQYEPKMKVFDWIFFLQLFWLKPDIKCAFIDAQTYYRQHSENMLGRNSVFTKKDLIRILHTKCDVYKFCAKIGITQALVHYRKMDDFKKSIVNNEELFEKYLDFLNKQKRLFWFEETELLLDQTSAS